MATAFFVGGHYNCLIFRSTKKARMKIDKSLWVRKPAAHSCRWRSLPSMAATARRRAIDERDHVANCLLL